MCKKARPKNVFWMVLSVLIVAPVASLAQDLDHDRRIEQLESKVDELSNAVRVLTKQINLLRMQIKDRPAAANSLLAQPEDEPSQSNLTSWVVKVSSNTTPDTSGMQRNIDRAHVNMKTLETRLKRNERELIDLKRQKTWREESTRGKSATLKGAVNDKKRAIRKTRAEIGKEKSLARKMMREIRLAKNSRKINGITAEGEPVIITAKGSAAMTAATIRTGEWYLISGSGRIVGGVVRIGMTTATTTDAPREDR